MRFKTQRLIAIILLLIGRCAIALPEPEIYKIQNNSSEKIKLSLFLACEDHAQKINASKFSQETASISPNTLEASQSGDLKINWQALTGIEGRKITDEHYCRPDTLVVVLQVTYSSEAAILRENDEKDSKNSEEPSPKIAPSEDSPVVCQVIIYHLEKPDVSSPFLRSEITNRHYTSYIWKHNKRELYCNFNDHVLTVEDR